MSTPTFEASMSYSIAQIEEVWIAATRPKEESGLGSLAVTEIYRFETISRHQNEARDQLCPIRGLLEMLF